MLSNKKQQRRWRRRWWRQPREMDRGVRGRKSSNQVLCTTKTGGRNLLCDPRAAPAPSCTTGSSQPASQSISKQWHLPPLLLAPFSSLLVCRSRLYRLAISSQAEKASCGVSWWVARSTIFPRQSHWDPSCPHQGAGLVPRPTAPQTASGSSELGNATAI